LGISDLEKRRDVKGGHGVRFGGCSRQDGDVVSRQHAEIGIQVGVR